MARYLPGLLAALLFGCSAPLITLLAGQGGALAVAALLYLEAVDMFSLVLIGNSTTRFEHGQMVTPRGYPGAELS